MNTLVIYRSKYGSTRQYAEWIAEALGADVKEAHAVTVEELLTYEGLVYGGGLYGETINGLGLITKNLERLADKRIAVFSTGLTPPDCHEYYDKMVLERNFKNGLPTNVRVFHYLGKMKMEELTLVHRTAIKALKKLMSGKENPTELEQLLIKLCDADGDFSDRASIDSLVEYMKA